ncbi:hypothetical protein RB9792 [Rhodopirellula baltica SH 1]|uniref:Uncharacterized protein n=1 Tax=Rhodopirellula baltica (strain DSM 10527 / NCIMB 13988 / SH1) TaxID=243090 RepID=Q7UL20_RHOBA|nr:hypothetical protein RB9792 [Rhodopirellula baltica SH 1]
MAVRPGSVAVKPRRTPKRLNQSKAHNAAGCDDDRTWSEPDGNVDI